MSPNDDREEIVWIDGEIVPANRASVSVLDHGFLFGDGVFEGIRVTAAGIFRFDDHMRRLETAVRAIGLEIDGGMDRVRDVARETTRAWGPREGYLRLIVNAWRWRLGAQSGELPNALDRLHRRRACLSLGRESGAWRRFDHLQLAAAGG